MAYAVSKGIAITRRACSRVGYSSCSNDYIRHLNLTNIVTLVHILQAIDLAISNQNLGYTRIALNLHIIIATIELQRISYIGSFATCREYTLTTLGNELNAHTLEETHRSTIRKLRHRHMQPFAICTHILSKLLNRAGIGQVTTTFTRNTHLSCRFLHLFEQQHLVAYACGCSCRHQACCTTSNNHYIVVWMRQLHL